MTHAYQIELIRALINVVLTPLVGVTTLVSILPRAGWRPVPTVVLEPAAVPPGEGRSSLDQMPSTFFVEGCRAFPPRQSKTRFPVARLSRMAGRNGKSMEWTR